MQVFTRGTISISVYIKHIFQQYPPSGAVRIPSEEYLVLMASPWMKKYLDLFIFSSSEEKVLRDVSHDVGSMKL